MKNKIRGVTSTGFEYVVNIKRLKANKLTYFISKEPNVANCYEIGSYILGRKQFNNFCKHSNMKHIKKPLEYKNFENEIYSILYEVFNIFDFNKSKLSLFHIVILLLTSGLILYDLSHFFILPLFTDEFYQFTWLGAMTAVLAVMGLACTIEDIFDKDEELTI